MDQEPSTCPQIRGLNLYQARSHDRFVPQTQVPAAKTPGAKAPKAPAAPAKTPKPSAAQADATRKRVRPVPPFISSTRASALASETRSESRNAFSAVLSTQGRVVGRWWAKLKPKGPKGPVCRLCPPSTTPQGAGCWPTGVPPLQENAPPWDPTVGLCLGS